MRHRGKYRAAMMLAALMIGLAVVFFLFAGSRFQELVVAVAGLVGAIAIWFQMKRSKDMAEGEFIVSLNESFIQNDDVKQLYTKLISGDPISRESQTAIVEYLTFFETIYLLVDRDVVEIKLVDDLFRYRFFLAVRNHDIQELELLPDAKYYMNIYTLDYIWTEYRRRNGDPEALTDDSLRARNPQYFDYVKVKTREP